MLVTEDTPTDEQQTNWIKDESLGYKGVEVWKGRLVWGGGMVINILQYPGTIHVTIATTQVYKAQPHIKGNGPWDYTAHPCTCHQGSFSFASTDTPPLDLVPRPIHT